jgi:hypothetical protein
MSPRSSKSWVIPIFFPRIPTTDIGASFPHHAGLNGSALPGLTLLRFEN